MMDVIDFFELGITLLDYFIKSHAPYGCKTRVERAEALHACIRTHMLIMIKLDSAHLILDRNNGLRKTTLGPGLCRPLLAGNRIGVDIVTRKPIFGGNRIGADALRCKITFHCQLGISRPGTATSAHWHPRHAFDTTANGHVGFACHHFCRRHITSFQTRGAEPVDLHACRGFGIVGVQDRNPGDITPLLANRRHTAKNNIIDIARVQLIAVAYGLQ